MANEKLKLIEVPTSRGDAQINPEHVSAVIKAPKGAVILMVGGHDLHTDLSADVVVTRVTEAQLTWAQMRAAVAKGI
jgi:hypothetical protein